MEKRTLTGVLTQFQPYQIVCLESPNSYLYSEVIQVVTSRQLCWVRPLLLFSHSLQEILDLRDTSDLLLPISLFQPALDTEVIPLLTQLPESNFLSDDTQARFQLRNFINEVWQAHKNVF